MASPVKKMCRWALRLGVAALIAVALLLGIAPRLGVARAIVVLGPSMGHTLPLGSLVISTPEPASAVRVGQIISFQSPVGDHQVETHRVVKVLVGGPHPAVWTQGDANPSRDPWTARIDGSTVWRVRADIPYIGYLLRELRGAAAHDALVVAVPAVWAALGLWALWAPAGRVRGPRLRRRSGRGPASTGGLPTTP